MLLIYLQELVQDVQGKISTTAFYAEPLGGPVRWHAAITLLISSF